MRPSRAMAVAVTVTLATGVFVVASPLSARPAASAPAATFVTCNPFPGVTATCGTVDVPLDRAQPAAGTIPIYFELYRHRDSSQPPLGAIVPSGGGPGLANTAFRPLWLSVFGPLLDRRDLLVIDDRGTGRSAAIDCPALQHFTGDLTAAVRACGAQLGAASSRYGSGDVADDVDVVRAALGIDQIDYYGGSFGAHDVRAYAYRHPDHLQAAVLDSPWLSPDYTFQASNARFYARVQTTVCRRSPSCIGANPDPESVLARLAQRLRAHPIDGIGYDANGVPHAVHVDESTIMDLLSAKYNATPLFLNQGELTAAAQALGHGDSVPLLRLAAESPQATDSGDPSAFFSMGASVATFCSDARLVYDTNAPEATRRAQLEAAFAALPADAFAPFSAAAWRTVNERLPKGVPGGFPADWCVPYHGVGRFPVHADQAIPARIDPTGINQGDEQDRQVASVAWSTVLDAVMRAEKEPPRMTGTSGRGLRGGTYTVTKSSTTTTIDYQAVRFSNDVTVTGHATRDLASNTIDAQVTVEQTEDQSQGTLSFRGVLYTPSKPDGQVRGTIDGRQVALLVPMN